MVSGKFKSKTFAKKARKTPSGSKTVFELRKPGKAVCPITGKQLHGIPHLRPKKLANLPKTKKRPERAYGGVLSSQASRRIIMSKARSE